MIMFVDFIFTALWIIAAAGAIGWLFSYFKAYPVEFPLERPLTEEEIEKKENDDT